MVRRQPQFQFKKKRSTTQSKNPKMIVKKYEWTRQDDDKVDLNFWNNQKIKDVLEDIKNPKSQFYQNNLRKIENIKTSQKTNKIQLNSHSAKILGLKGFNKNVAKEVDKIQKN